MKRFVLLSLCVLVLLLGDVHCEADLPEELNQQHMSISEWSNTIDILCIEHFPLNLSNLMNLSYVRPQLESLSVSGCPITGSIPESWVKLDSLTYLSFECKEFGTALGHSVVLMESLRANIPQLLALRIKDCGLFFDFASLITTYLPSLAFIDLSGNQLYGSIADGSLIAHYCLGRYSTVKQPVSEFGYKCTQGAKVHMLEGKSSSTPYGLLYKNGNLSAAYNLPVIVDLSKNNILGGPDNLYSDITGVGVSQQICSAGCVSLVITDEGDIPCVTTNGGTVWYMQDNPWTVEHNRHSFASGFVVFNRHNWCREEEADIVLLVTWSVGLGLVVLAIAAGLFQRWRYRRGVRRYKRKRLTVTGAPSLLAGTPAAKSELPAGGSNAFLDTENPTLTNSADLASVEAVTLVSGLQSDYALGPQARRGQPGDLSLDMAFPAFGPLGEALPISMGVPDPEVPPEFQRRSRDTLWRKVVKHTTGVSGVDLTMRRGLLKDCGPSSSSLDHDPSTTTNGHAFTLAAHLGSSTAAAVVGGASASAVQVSSLTPPRSMGMDFVDMDDETEKLQPDPTESAGRKFCDCMTLPIKKLLDFIDQIPQSDRGVQLRCVISLATFAAEVAMMCLLLFEQGGLQLLLLLPNIIVQTVGGLALMRASTLTLMFNDGAPQPGSAQHALAAALNIEMAAAMEDTNATLRGGGPQWGAPSGPWTGSGNGVEKPATATTTVTPTVTVSPSGQQSQIAVGVTDVEAKPPAFTASRQLPNAASARAVSRQLPNAASAPVSVPGYGIAADLSAAATTGDPSAVHPGAAASASGPGPEDASLDAAADLAAQAGSSEVTPASLDTARLGATRGGSTSSALLGDGLIAHEHIGDRAHDAEEPDASQHHHRSLGAKLLDAPKQQLFRGLAELRRHARILKLTLRPSKLSRGTTVLGILFFPITLTASIAYMVYRIFTPSRDHDLACMKVCCTPIEIRASIRRMLMLMETIQILPSISWCVYVSVAYAQGNSVGTSFQYVSTPIFFVTVPVIFFGVLNFAYRYSSLHIPLLHFWKYDLFDVSPEGGILGIRCLQQH